MRALLTAGLAALLASGCGPGAIGVDIDRDLPAQTIPGNAAAHTVGVALAGELPGTQAYDDAVNTAAAESSVKPPHLALKVLTLQIQKAAAATTCWDFLQSATVSVQSQRANSALPTLEIAHAATPGCVETLDFVPVATADLRPYIDEGVHFIVRVDGTVPESDVTFTGHVTLRGAL